MAPDRQFIATDYQYKVAITCWLPINLFIYSCLAGQHQWRSQTSGDMRTQWPKCSRNRKWKWLQRHPGGAGRRGRLCPLRLLQRRHGQTPGGATGGGTEEGRQAGERVCRGTDGRREVLLHRCVFSRVRRGGGEGGRAFLFLFSKDRCRSTTQTTWIQREC